MAKYEYQTNGNIDSFISEMKQMVNRLGLSIKIEDEHMFDYGDTKISTVVYERYSMIGGNRLSLSITTVSVGEHIDLVAIPAGGSQAKLFKINTLGESSILNDFRRGLERLQKTW